MNESRIFRHQIQTLAIANLKARYRKTFAGFLWVVLNPLIMFGVQSLVFRKFIRLEVPDYGMFLLSGLLPWIFILQTLEMSTSLLVVNGRLLKSFPLNPLVCLLAQLCDNAVNFVAAFVLVLVPVWIRTPGSKLGLIFLPLPILTLFIGVFGLAWLLASLQVFFRDTRFMVSFVMSFAFFLTPVFYPVEYVPSQFRWMVLVNPFHHLLVPFRMSLYSFTPQGFAHAIGVAAGVALFFLGAAAVFWRLKRNDVYLNI
ncbi:MAG: ABC transporter permease [Deltaproteobacteria bacterium]|nr:ABC transporter permease [Deltaproteobacteria bacterium]